MLQPYSSESKRGNKDNHTEDVDEEDEEYVFNGSDNDENKDKDKDEDDLPINQLVKRR